MQFETVFDAAQTGYRTWPFAAFGLIFVVVGALLVFAPLLMQAILPGGLQGRPRVYFSRAFLGFAICWTTIAFASTFSEYRSIRYALATGQYETVKGKVTDFIPMPHGGHAMESFSVNHVNFSYSDFVITNGSTTRLPMADLSARGSMSASHISETQSLSLKWPPRLWADQSLNDLNLRAILESPRRGLAHKLRPAKAKITGSNPVRRPISRYLIIH